MMQTNMIQKLSLCMTQRVSVAAFVLILCVVSYCQGGEYTFELQDNEKQCFHEIINKSEKATLEYQVVTGGNYDVDVEISGPDKQHFYKEVRKQYDSHTWETKTTGEYIFCFSNEFSTFAHKTVYFDFQVGDEPRIGRMRGAQYGPGDGAMTLLEMSADSIHNAMNTIIDYQTHHRLREAQGRAFAEDLGDRVWFWSIGQSIVILVVGIGQILVLKSFFSDRRYGLPMNT